MSLAHLQAELANLDRMIRECPPDDVVGRISLVARRERVEQELHDYCDRAAERATRPRRLALAVGAAGQLTTLVAAFGMQVVGDTPKATMCLILCLGFLGLNMMLARE